jgi:AcrR family transcriptional regulator
MARPRSARAHEQVLEAALELFAERGIDGASMDAIAEASGVSKATIYKHWPDKDSLCLEAMARANGLDEEPPVIPADDIRAAMVILLSHRPKRLDVERQKRLMPHFMAYAARNPGFGMTWRARVLEPPQKRLRPLLKRGIEEGIFPEDLDYDLAFALLLGPLMYGYFLSLTKNKTLEDLPERVVGAFWKAHAVAKPSRRCPPSKPTKRG